MGITNADAVPGIIIDTAKQIVPIFVFQCFIAILSCVLQDD
ncbi:hypothetical protein EVA_17321 [gut metagenome]|uniref:Uncharacterized protein n=1 Tax=gut metagenome TaxID=749906 RepID=J9FYG8_9ZZZZ